MSGNGLRKITNTPIESSRFCEHRIAKFPFESKVVIINIPEIAWTQDKLRVAPQYNVKHGGDKHAHFIMDEDIWAPL